MLNSFRLRAAAACAVALLATQCPVFAGESASTKASLAAVGPTESLGLVPDAVADCHALRRAIERRACLASLENEMPASGPSVKLTAQGGSR